jgi:glutaredoxin
MDRDSILMKFSFAIILGVLAFYVYKWWLGTKSSYVADPAVPGAPAAPAFHPDTPPSGPGITMYGSDSCPWCTKQKDHFQNTGKDYTFVDCAKGQCPNFVTGFPTLVVDGQIKVGYQEI